MKTSVLVVLVCSLASVRVASAFPSSASLADIRWERVLAGGRPYYDVTATLNGTGPSDAAPYNVPVELFYPADAAHCNGTGVVDLLNNSAMLLLASEGVAQPPLASARARLTDEFLARRGYVYLSVQWEKSRGPVDVIALFNQLFGTQYAIPTGDDQFAIILDVAALLKAPPAALPGAPCAVTSAIAYGMSASATPLNLLKQPALVGASFATAFAARYDGVVLDSITSGFSPFPVAKTGVKTIAISAETDVQLFKNDVNVRGENAEYRAYEVAGVTHVSREQHDLSAIAPHLPAPPSLPLRQNLATQSPFFRAALEHLRGWITRSTPPPPSTYLAGASYSLLPVSCTNLPIPGLAAIPRDSDGNALGGVRLPFLASPLPGHSPSTVGAPLGRYDGTELQYGCRAGGFPQLALVTGTFTPSPLLLSRYPTHAHYVLAVSLAAQRALSQGWLLPEDALAYVLTALRCPVGLKPAHAITQTELELCHGG